MNPPPWSIDSQVDAQSAWEIASKKRPSNATLLYEGEEANTLNEQGEEEDHQSSTDDEEYANRFAGARFPSAAEVKRAVIQTLSVLEKDHEYLVLGDRQSQSQCTSHIKRQMIILFITRECFRRKTIQRRNITE